MSGAHGSARACARGLYVDAVPAREALPPFDGPVAPRELLEREPALSERQDRHVRQLAQPRVPAERRFAKRLEADRDLADPFVPLPERVRRRGDARGLLLE